MDTGTREYEFDDEENASLRSVAAHAMAWGALCTVVGVACLGLALRGAFATVHADVWRLQLAAGVVFTLIGVNFFVAGRDFRAAVHTHGCDIRHVMLGLTHLSRAVVVQIAIALGTLAVVVLAALLFGSA